VIGNAVLFEEPSVVPSLVAEADEQIDRCRRRCLAAKQEAGESKN
jgi:hypothetical protein